MSTTSLQLSNLLQLSFSRVRRSLLVCTYFIAYLARNPVIGTNHCLNSRSCNSKNIQRVIFRSGSSSPFDTEFTVPLGLLRFLIYAPESWYRCFPIYRAKVSTGRFDREPRLGPSQPAQHAIRVHSYRHFDAYLASFWLEHFLMCSISAWTDV